MILFVQPFGLCSPGGGPRILRSLVKEAPVSVVSVCSSPAAPPPVPFAREFHLPVRPEIKLLERGRLAPIRSFIEDLSEPAWELRLLQLAREQKATGIHGIAHSMDFWGSFRVSQSLGIPFYLTVHDDLRYALRGRHDLNKGLQRLTTVWQQATQRFVISEEMGQEYCRRYGEYPFTIVTDGLDNGITPVPAPDIQGLSLYFMGMFHYSYLHNLNSLLAALELVRREQPSRPISLRMRCGSLPKKVTDAFPRTILPFGSEEDVARDMQSANLLYLPIQFTPEDSDFYKFSLSTKMITYLGSGIPILYHGPADSAACSLLRSHNAAILINDLNPHILAQNLSKVPETSTLIANALRLGREHFDLSQIRRRFWTTITRYGDEDELETLVQANQI